MGTLKKHCLYIEPIFASGFAMYLKKNPCNFLVYRDINFVFVVPPGFEPRQTEPKSVVLPLHNGTKFKFGRKGINYSYIFAKIFCVVCV